MALKCVVCRSHWRSRGRIRDRAIARHQSRSSSTFLSAACADTVLPAYQSSFPPVTTNFGLVSFVHFRSSLKVVQKLSQFNPSPSHQKILDLWGFFGPLWVLSKSSLIYLPPSPVTKKKWACHSCPSWVLSKSCPVPPSLPLLMLVAFLSVLGAVCRRRTRRAADILLESWCLLLLSFEEVTKSRH